MYSDTFAVAPRHTHTYAQIRTACCAPWSSRWRSSRRRRRRTRTPWRTLCGSTPGRVPGTCPPCLCRPSATPVRASGPGAPRSSARQRCARALTLAWRAGQLGAGRVHGRVQPWERGGPGYGAAVAGHAGHRAAGRGALSRRRACAPSPRTERRTRGGAGERSCVRLPRVRPAARPANPAKRARRVRGAGGSAGMARARAADPAVPRRPVRRLGSLACPGVGASDRPWEAAPSPRWQVRAQPRVRADRTPRRSAWSARCACGLGVWVTVRV
jgi:hypothetical protein